MKKSPPPEKDPLQVFCERVAAEAKELGVTSMVVGAAIQDGIGDRWWVQTYGVPLARLGLLQQLDSVIRTQQTVPAIVVPAAPGTKPS